MNLKRIFPLGIVHLIFGFAVIGTASAQKAVEFSATQHTLSTNAIAQQNYAGTDRKAAKTSIAAGSATTYSDLISLINTLPTDSHMRSLNIPEDSTSNRVTEEQKNVTVDAWVYATTEEADNDLHIILGTDPAKSPVHYLTAEVTGLPSSGPFRAPLTQARKEAVGAIGIYVHAGSYKILPQPEHVQVSGSLFYDVDHSPGTVGPSGMRPSTSWEIHPVTQITGL